MTSNSGLIPPTLGENVREELEAAITALIGEMDAFPDARSLFLTGSAVTGEWAATHTDEGWYFFSDLDIGVVCDPRDPDLERTVRDALQGSILHVASARRWVRAPRANVAFFSLRELGYQPAKPGTFEMINQAVVLWGDRSIRDRFPRISVEDLTWEEAIRILGNRVLELLERPAGKTIRPLDYYRLAKLFCDLATALLVPEGGYVTGSRERARRLPALLSERPLPAKLDMMRDRVIESVEFWTAFRSGPRFDLLEKRYGVDPASPEAHALYGGIWCEARQQLEAVLEALLPHRLMDEFGRPDPEALGRTSGWGTWRQRFREWRWLARYANGFSAGVWRRGAGMAFRLSPVEITYLTAFILFVRSVDGPPPCYLDRDLVRSLARWCPLPDASWTTGEEVREGVIRLWRYWLPRI